MKKILFLISFLLLALPAHAPNAQMLVGITGAVTPGTCVNPTTTSQWIASNSCSSGAACMNDAVSSNNAVQTVSGNRPTYTAYGIFNKPYLTFATASSQFLNLTSTIPTSNTTYSFYAVLNNTSLSANNYLVAGGAGAIGYGIGSSGKQGIAKVSTAWAASGTNAIAANKNYAIAATFNTSTNAYQFFLVSGGGYTSDGSGTATAETYTVAMSYLGYANAYAAISTPEMGYYNGIWNSTQLQALATYVNCQYGL